MLRRKDLGERPPGPALAAHLAQAGPGAGDRPGDLLCRGGAAGAGLQAEAGVLAAQYRGSGWGSG